MPAKRFPNTSEERIDILRAIIKQEEAIDLKNGILSVSEQREVYNLLLAFENALSYFKQTLENEIKADKSYSNLFKTAQLYISHFIQVLNLAVVRNEIKAEALLYYGFENNHAFTVPDLSTEEAILKWGEQLIKGETERISRGGAPIYCPTISKVIVHYDLFKEATQSLELYRKNTNRCRETIDEMNKKIDRLIWDTWTKVEFQYWKLPEEERRQKFNDYGIMFHGY
ncbi:MAG: hypothetical protein LBG15_07455 [Dysgonamonadaceae bacterium]|jgi:hypothetical protein|nr:hypothetical protein [Dysgonamonadaceae bacterium]